MRKADAHRLSGLDQTEVRHGHGHRRKGLALVCADWCGRHQADQVFFANNYSASDEKRAESTLEEAGPIAAATENAVLTATESFSVPVNAEVKVDTDAQIDSAVPDQEEIQRRRDLVRTLFNDFWSEAHDKPAAFVERLDQAEDYVNERLTACGEFWRLDASTRVMLGLPPRANSPNNRKNGAARG